MTRGVLGPAFRYTVARIVLVAATAAVLYVIGFRGWALAFAAVITSLPLSWFVLRSQRERLANAWAEHSIKRSQEKTKLRKALRGEED